MISSNKYQTEQIFFTCLHLLHLVKLTVLHLFPDIYQNVAFYLLLVTILKENIKELIILLPNECKQLLIV